MIFIINLVCVALALATAAWLVFNFLDKRNAKRKPLTQQKTIKNKPAGNSKTLSRPGTAAFAGIMFSLSTFLYVPGDLQMQLLWLFAEIYLLAVLGYDLYKRSRSGN